MTNDERSTNDQITEQPLGRAHHRSDFVGPSGFVIHHSPLVIAFDAELGALVREISAADRVAIDIEADSLHCYREKLCLLQISLPSTLSGRGNADFIVDPLAVLNLDPLRGALEAREIVLHSADYDLRMLRRGLGFTAHNIFDTLIAARLLGIREFSLAALLKRYFALELPKGSQKANWAKRPLSARMAEYAINDVRYLLPLSEKLQSELDRHQRSDWLRQSCQRAIEQASMLRVRNEDELWRIPGSGSLHGRPAAVLRALWQWREQEAQRADRPAFHILRNEHLLEAAIRFVSGGVPDYKYFSPRRRRAFRDAAGRGLEEPEAKWPVSRRRSGARPSADTLRRMDELRRRRDQAAEQLGLERSFIAPRSTMEAIAANSATAASLLVPWQRELLGVT
jgi:ribonuclease D